MKKRFLTVLSISALTFGVAFVLINQNQNYTQTRATTNYVVPTNGCSKGSLPKTIYLDAVDESDIRSYYSSLNSLSESERQGTNLLKNLKTILYEMNYLDYGGIGKSGGGVSYAYTITDRDWDASPATSISGGTYNQSTNTITNYNHYTEITADPYIHMLYVDYSKSGPTKFKLPSNPSNPNFDKEHVWCQSRGFKAYSKTDGAAAIGPAGTDMHHLIAGDSFVNQHPHNNNPYGFVKNASEIGDQTYTADNKSGTAKHTSPSDQSNLVFEPQDSDKGDIARAIFYMAARYNNYSGEGGITKFEPFLSVVNYATSSGESEYSSDDTPVSMGILSDLLAWNKIDPVDEYEIHRNDLIYRNYQGNRNPFIDFPQWIDYIWGTADLEGNNYNPTVTGFAKPSTDTVYYKGGGETTIPVTGITLNKTSLTGDIFLSSTTKINATVLPLNATNQNVSWSSSNSSVATVDNTGLVTFKSVGTAVITATTEDGGFSATCNVEVIDTTPIVTGVTLSKASASLDLTRVNSVQLSATVEGENDPPSSVTWSSNDESVATVDSTGLVTAVAVGETTVTATSTYDNTKSASCTITVSDATISKDTFTYISIGVTGTAYSSWTNKSFGTAGLFSGNTAAGNAAVQLRSGTTKGSDVHSGIITTLSPGYAQKVVVEWHSESDANRTLSVYGKNSAYSNPNDLYDSSTQGTLIGTIAKTGTTLTISNDYSYIGIRSTDGAIYLNSIEITWELNSDYTAPTSVGLDVHEKTIKVNEQFSLSQTVLPNTATNKEVTWSSSDEKVAVVSSDGKVTALSSGTAIITVDTVDKHFKDTCTVEVLNNPKFKNNPFSDGVAYKMYHMGRGYFNGSTTKAIPDDYYLTTSVSISEGKDVFFETVGGHKRLYFYKDDVKQYIIAYSNSKYNNLAVRDASVFEDTEMNRYEWNVDELGRLYVLINEIKWTMGTKVGQTFTTIALNRYSDVNRFVTFEYTAESFSKDLIERIGCDPEGIDSPEYEENYSWNDFKLIFTSIETSYQNELKTTSSSETGTIIQQGLAKYDYLVSKYGYENFLQRNIQSLTNSFNSNSAKANSSIVIVVIAGTFVTLAIGLGLSFRKRKED